jgi:hypothetical protein
VAFGAVLAFVFLPARAETVVTSGQSDASQADLSADEASVGQPVLADA